MPRAILAFILAAWGCAVGAAAGPSILPNQFGSWQAESPAKIMQIHDLDHGWARWPNGERVLKEAGLDHIEQRTYRNGGDEVRIRAFVLRDPSSAYQVYTFLLAPGMRDLAIGKDSAGTDSEADFLVGNMVVQASLTPTLKGATLHDLFTQLQAKADSAPLPPLKSYLPEHWKIFGSEKYALGPEAFRAAMTALRQDAGAGLATEVGFQNGVEAMLADYKGQHGSGTLVLLDYPTPQLAEQHLHHIEQALPEALKRAGVTVER